MRLLLPVLACLPLATLTGCHSQMPGADALQSAPVSSAEQSQVERAAQGYVAALQGQDYRGAEAMMSPAYRAQTPPARLRTLLKGPDQPFLGAKGFQFEPIQTPLRGTHIVLRARFLGGDGKPYRTNFLFAPTGTAWQVSGIAPPATHQVPNTKQIRTS